MGKKILALFLSVVLILGMFPGADVSAASVEEAKYTIVADKTVAHPGDTVCFTVTVDLTGSMTAFEATICLPEELRLVPGSLQVISEEELGFQKTNSNEAALLFSGYGAYPYTGTGAVTLASFRCVVQDDATAGVYSVTLADTWLDDQNYEYVDHGVVPVDITVTIPVAGITLNRETLTIGNQNDTVVLAATVLPENATNKKVFWTSSNPEIADIGPDGRIIPGNHPGGVVTITATTEDGEKTASCVVTVFCEHGQYDSIGANDATCTEDGNHGYDLCAVCGFMRIDGTWLEFDKNAVAIPAKGHNYEAVVTDPACTTQGFTTHTCSNCGESFVDSYADALGHAYGEWETTKEATYEEDGEEYRKCSRCGDVQTRKIPMLTHSYESIVTAPTCTEQGYTTHTCTDCGDSYVDTHVNALGHSFKDYVSDNNATCISDGTKTAKCDRCDMTDTIPDAGTAKGHALSDWTVVTEPTCTEKGKEQRSCANCNHVETKEIVATGHEYESVVTAATCEAKGYTTHSCTKCDESYMDSYVDALGHAFGEWTQTKAPACEEAGEESRECATCGDTEKRVLEATGHNYEAVVTAPTCEEKGYTTHTCAKCGDSYADSYVDAIGHSFEDGTCSNCGEPEIKYLRGDVDLDGDVDVDDVLALLWHVLFPDMYPIEVDADFDGNAATDVDDVLALLWHVLFPDMYPI